MKKTALLAVALATCLGYAPARAADVVSSNIVGYNKLSLTESTQATTGYTMIGVPFCEVGGDALTFGTLFTDEITKDLVGGYGQEDSDTVQIWGGGKYTTYYFSAADWSEEMGDGEVDEYKNNKWLDEDGEPATQTPFAPGSAAWFGRPAGLGTDTLPATMAGEVPSGDYTVEIAAHQYAMVSYPFPVGFLLNDSNVDWSNVQGGYGSEDADTIQLWGNGKYTTYYFSAADWSEEMGDGEVDEYKNNKWLDEDGEPVSEAIDLCKGFWFKRNGDSKLTLTFPNPL